MSVIKSKRKVSEMEFLMNARRLQVYTVQKCVSVIPKRYTFYLGEEIALCARRIYGGVKKGNSIYPTNAHEVQLRRDYFLRALADLQDLVSQIEVANEIIRFDDKVLHEWAALISKEMELVTGVLKRDKERYKNLT